MQHGQLLSHVDTDLVTREQLRMIATPEFTNTFHPIPHAELVDTLDLVLAKNQIQILDEKFAVRRDGSVLFGVLQLAYGDCPEGQAALGLRTSNNKSFAIQICAGLSVLVCDNLAFRGDMIALCRKHTSGLELRTELSRAVLRFEEHFGILAGEIAHLKEHTLEDQEAKAFIHDAFIRGIMPIRFLPEVSTAYFQPQLPEFEPRTSWSLHNAFTGAAKAMPMTTRLQAIQELGQLFGMSSEPAPEGQIIQAA
ncbi:MAG: DUF932 domain-containing protein [Terriglobia bacterium]|nr:DUF932 domain-containing protein [Terriglobia bacterium]